MARRKERDLSQALRDARFAFIPRGERHIDEIYRTVQANYPSLCDDSYYCSENCSSGNEQPEWKHTVRNALQSMKRTGIRFTGKRGYWLFP